MNRTKLDKLEFIEEEWTKYENVSTVFLEVTLQKDAAIQTSYYYYNIKENDGSSKVIKVEDSLKLEELNKKVKKEENDEVLKITLSALSIKTFSFSSLNRLKFKADFF